MSDIKKNVMCLMLITMACGRSYVSAQSIPSVPNPVCAYCGTSVPNGVHSSSCPYYAGKSKTGGTKRGPHAMDMNTMVTMTLFESLLTSLFTTDTANAQEAQAAREKAAALAAQQAEAAARAQAAADQAAHDRMMQLYKPLNGGQGLAFRTLSNSTLGFKPLSSDNETLAAAARKPFDTPSDSNLPAQVTLGAPTPFFGDTMPIDQIQTLVNPENDPRVVDLRQAVTFVAENIKNDSEKLEAATQPDKDRINREANQHDLDCDKLRAKLTSQINQRTRFQKTINLSQSQLTTWETANRNALLNAAKDGLEVFTGKLLDRFAKRCQAADRLEQIYKKHAAQMVQEGVDISQIQAKIDRIRILASAGRISELTSNISDWQTFVKDGISSLMAQLTSSNDEIQGMLDDPMMQKYFEQDTPELKALLDISMIAASNKVFGTWVAKKVPLIAGVQLAINQLYNATDFYLSYERIVEANKINGRVMAAARGLQQDIDDTYRALGDCP